MSTPTCRISAVSDDWAMKGCHIHVGRVEVSLHPDHLGGLTFDCPFSSTSAESLEAAISVVQACLADGEFLSRLISAIERATEHMPSVQGFWATKANGRLKEFKHLLQALHRMHARS